MLGWTTQHVLICYFSLYLVAGEARKVTPSSPLLQLLPTKQELFLKDLMYRGLGLSKDNIRARYNAARSAKKIQKVYEGEFPCADPQKFRSASPPTSVHRVMPGDIDIVAALGDSLTAAMGATASTLMQVIIENRGLSWSIGGQGTWRDSLTLPNILREFNPALFGFSLGDGPSHSRQSVFNVAEPGAIGSDLPYMTKVLVKRIKADPRVDVDNHWKLVTLLMGNNDGCGELCHINVPEEGIEMLRKSLRESLDYLREHLPRTIVNLVPVPSEFVVHDLRDLNLLLKLPNLPPTCSVPHTVMCPCLFGPKMRSKRQNIVKLLPELQAASMDVLADGSYEGDDNFAVVLQPFTLDLEFPTYVDNKGRNSTDMTFFAPDCFHFSQKGYARGANALWNNMMEPVGKKSRNWFDEYSKFLCPSLKQPYIFTTQNSDISSRL